MTLANEFGDGVSDDLVMLFSRNTCVDVVVENGSKCVGTLVVVCVTTDVSWAGRIMLRGTYNGEHNGVPEGAQY